jgi:tRNA nucleotidyltransferase (CCA-adding enzyme)
MAEGFWETPVVELMSRGVHTVEAGAALGAIIGRLRGLGHEGYPVLGDDGALVGLLTLRDADKALEHGLDAAAVREVMIAGRHTIAPTDTLGALIAQMDASGWGQMPVSAGGLVLDGIVTRTDILRHLARAYRAVVGEAKPGPALSLAQIEAVLGAPVAGLIAAIADAARSQGVRLYLVGGPVRDLLLGRANFDLDFVVEGVGGPSEAMTTAERLARALAAARGGAVTAHPPFGTAKWRLADAPTSGLPAHIDFATARREFYPHPAALPTVSDGSIKLDLARRDFTINTLALQLSPQDEAWRVLDYFGGLDDLRAGVVRALHSLSFVDDPTRALRAARFAQRLGFALDPRTAELIALSRPTLARITGERLRNELSLLLAEARPEDGLRDLAARGVLAAIHPDFALRPEVPAALEVLRDERPAFAGALDRVALNWHVLLGATADPDRTLAVAERLLIGRTEAESLADVARLLAMPGPLADPDARSSEIDRALTGLSDAALAALWALRPDATWRERLTAYATTWRHVRPSTDGHRLRALGLPPGPRYRALLDRLRAARLDGEIATDDDEAALLQALL